MIVLAESNFLLELALERDEVEHAERIVRLSEGGQITLRRFADASGYIGSRLKKSLQ